MLLLGALEAGGLVSDQGAHLAPLGDVGVEAFEHLVDMLVENRCERA